MRRLLLPLALLALAVGCKSKLPAPQPSPNVFGSHVHAYADLPGTVVRSDGSIPFTSPQGGVAPVAGSDLTTKTYVLSVASGASATKKVLVSGLDTTEDYLDPTLTVSAPLTKTIGSGGANETLNLGVTFGTTASTICEGNDSRLTNGRAPTGSAGGDLTGTYPNPTFLYDRVRKDVFTTKGDILVTWGAGDVRRLAVGTDDYILTADSSASPGVAWKARPSLYPHSLLGHMDASSEAVAKGALIAGSTTTWTKLAASTNGYVLTMDSAEALGMKWAALPTAGSSTLLDGSLHTDTAAGTAVRGDLIVGNSTPKWSRFAKGTAYQRLRMNSGATDPEWAAEPSTPLTIFYRMNPAATTTAGVVAYGAIGGAASSYFTTIYAGTLTGISWQFSGTHNAGTITLRARKNGTGDNTLSLTSGTSDTSGYTTGTGMTFAAGDTLGVEFDTTGAWNGISGSLTVTLWVRWDS